MEFDWDAANTEHVARHGITIEECEEAYYNGPMVIEYQSRGQERRTLCLGETRAGRLLTFVFTQRQGKVRFVTAYPMHARQREIYGGQKES